MSMPEWSWPCFGMLLSWLGCALLLPALRRLAIEDLPGERRLHAQTVVRGGGLIIVLGMLAVLWQLPLSGIGSVGLLLALALVAATGMLDDVCGMSAWLKLPLLTSAATLLVLAAGFDPDWLSRWLPAWLPAPHWLLSAVLVIAVLWLINLFNFMDGSNGLAATQTILCCAGLLLFADPLLLDSTGLATLTWLLLSLTLGFLPWNFPRARMFLGDVGSLSLGLLLAALLLAALQHQAIDPAMAMLLPAVFVLDATATLLLRLSLGRKWYQAHTDHAYQQLVLSGWSHARVWLLYLLLNVLLVWPLLWLSRQWPAQSWLFCLLGYLLLCIGWALVQLRCHVRTQSSSLPLTAAQRGADQHV